MSTRTATDHHDYTFHTLLNRQSSDLFPVCSRSRGLTKHHGAAVRKEEGRVLIGVCHGRHLSDGFNQRTLPARLTSGSLRGAHGVCEAVVLGSPILFLSSPRTAPT